MSTVWVIQHSKGIALALTLLNEDGITPINLSEKTVKLMLKNKLAASDEDCDLDETCSYGYGLDPAKGECYYILQDGDVPDPGDFRAQVEVLEDTDVQYYSRVEELQIERRLRPTAT